MTDQTQEKFFTKKSSPRLCFWLGVFCGGLIITLAAAAYIGYLYGGGKFTVVNDELNVNLDTDQVLVEQAVEPLTNTGDDISISDYDYIYGQPDAETTLVVYTDFECPLCKIYHNTLINFIDANPDKVRLVIKNFALTQKHPEAHNAAVAAICAGEQDKYYEYAKQLFSHQSELCSSFYQETCTSLELDIDKFTACQDKSEISEKIAQDYQEGLDLGVHGIPNTVVIYPDNSLKLIDGNVSQEFLSSLLKEYL